VCSSDLERSKALDSLQVPAVTPANLPAELLLRRPDLAALEQMLIASNFNIGSAHAAYFPTISLTGLLGVTDLDIDNIYNGSVRTWALGTNLVGPLVDFGRTESGVDLALAKNREQLARYQAGVKTAFKEVRDALLSQKHTYVFAEEQLKRRKAMADALTLLNQRFSLGFANLPDVLSVKRSLHEAELATVSAKLNRLNASVDLYKALGGGWKMENGKK
jgi:multidrug efflux system outer membrane protein